MNRRKFIASLGASALGAGVLHGASSTPMQSNPDQAPSASLGSLLSLDDVEAQAQKVLTPAVYDFIAGGAADELTIKWNREKYRDIRLRQHVLEDLSKLDCSTTLLGQTLRAPILLAPTSNHRFVHSEGELATARGAGLAESTMVLSSGANTSIEEVVKVAQVEGIVTG